MIVIKKSFKNLPKSKKRPENPWFESPVAKNDPKNYVKTGGWATKRPKASLSCIKCGICVANCPEAALSLGREKVQIDYSFCKGCGICVEVCPKKAIAF